jgi:hypothetical protein
MGNGVDAVNLSADVTDAERQELAAVLSSPTFARSPRLVKLLEYISEKHFHGQEGQVCEYAIATEVLGRGVDFDSSDDAIARVEIHRLRKKLREYYAAEGAHRELKIIIPPGLYTPVFQRDGEGADIVPVSRKPHVELRPEPHPDVPHKETDAPPPVAPPAGFSIPWKRGAWLVAAALVVVIGGTLWAWRVLAHVEPAAPRLAPPAVAGAPDNAVRIIAGYDRKYIDHRGHTWLPDRYFEGGGRPAAPFRQFFARTSDPLLYQNGRIGLAAYNIPLKPGTYEMKLYFVEPVYGPGLETGGGENSRVFDVVLNGKLLIDGLDIVSDAGGPLIADVRVFKDIQPDPNGILRLGFHARREQPIISAIEIEPAEPHKLNPIRIVTQPNSVTDSRGQVWEADNYFSGGQPSNHWKAVTAAPDPDLFGNERYGHFSYAIPVAPGTYAATMYFAETYWGKENEGGGGPGQRLFDVYCNGSAIIRDLDILRETGPNKALIKKFRGLRPTAQGKLNFEFVPVANYASVFAIEVMDESR